jgi:mono/diheme cytochrome c family protein
MEPRAAIAVRLQGTFVPFDEKGMPNGTYETFADGFAGKPEFVSTNEARYRPAGVATGPDGSLYITDTEMGRIWRVIYTGQTSASSRPSNVGGPSAPAQEGARGARLYQQICAACHMPDGSGVSTMHPPLVGSTVLSGDPGMLIRVVLHGPAQVLPAGRPKYATVMPPFVGTLSDDDVAEILTYARRAFGKGASAVTPAQVSVERRILLR